MNFQKVNDFRSSLRHRPWGILVGDSVSYPTRRVVQLLCQSGAYANDKAACMYYMVIFTTSMYIHVCLLCRSSINILYPAYPYVFLDHLDNLLASVFDFHYQILRTIYFCIGFAFTQINRSSSHGEKSRLWWAIYLWVCKLSPRTGWEIYNGLVFS